MGDYYGSSQASKPPNGACGATRSLRAPQAHGQRFQKEIYRLCHRHHHYSNTISFNSAAP